MYVGKMDYTVNAQRKMAGIWIVNKQLLNLHTMWPGAASVSLRYEHENLKVCE